jgi:hypothetical protein
MNTWLVSFAYALCAIFWHAHVVPNGHADREIRAIASDVASTDAAPGEAAQLILIAGMESGFERTAHGALGEQGAWQVMPPARSYGAREALNRLREQGLYGFMGCTRRTERCEQMAMNRSLLASIWLVVEPPPSSVVALVP